MRRAIEDGALYYTLGYSPADGKMDGSYRHLEVKLTHGKGKLAYRHGYIASDALGADAKSGIDPLPPLLRLGLPDATGVPYGVSVKQSAIQPSLGEVSSWPESKSQKSIHPLHRGLRDTKRGPFVFPPAR